MTATILPFRRKAADTHRGCPGCTMTLPTANILAMQSQDVPCPRCSRHTIAEYTPVQYWAPWPPEVFQ